MQLNRSCKGSLAITGGGVNAAITNQLFVHKEMDTRGQQHEDEVLTTKSTRQSNGTHQPGNQVTAQWGKGVTSQSQGISCMHVGMQAWSRWPAQIQTEHQKTERMWFKWLWTVPEDQQFLKHSETADLLGFHHRTVSGVYGGWCETEQMSSGQQISGRKSFFFF